MKVERVAIERLSTTKGNARTHDKRNLDAIAASLSQFGQQKPIVVDRDGTVVAGNGTLEAAKALGWKTIAIVRTKLNGNQATGYALADNRTAELADWDFETLADQIRSLVDEDFDPKASAGQSTS